MKLTKSQFKHMFILFFAFSAVALADEPEEQTIERRVIYQQRTEIDFESVEVEGALLRPQGQLILDRRAGTFNPLIRLRTNFEPELNNSVIYIK